MLRWILALALACGPSIPAIAADWTTGPAPSDYPDLRAAVTESEEGHRMFVWSQETKDRRQVFAELHLGGGLLFSGEMPVYSVDGGVPHDTDLIRRAGEAKRLLWAHAAREAAFWLLWSPPEPIVQPGDALSAWFEGDRLEVRFRSADGAEHRAVFSLEGAQYAILAATGLRME